MIDEILLDLFRHCQMCRLQSHLRRHSALRFQEEEKSVETFPSSNLVCAMYFGRLISTNLHTLLRGWSIVWLLNFMIFRDP
jgi:hypothetical protein